MSLTPSLIETVNVESLDSAVSPPRLAAESRVRIGRFLVLRVLGRGAMGVVYAAYDETLDRRLAIKVIRSDIRRRDAARQRTLREAQGLARLSHPNVVQIYEVGEIAGQVFIAMEYLQGDTLTNWLRARERDWRSILAVFVQAGRGLAAAHAADLVHRDFKPESRRPSQTAPQPTNRPHSHKKGRSERGGASRRAPLCPGVDQVLAKPWQRPGPPEDRRGPLTRSPTRTRST